jgi:hypothetical protein
MPSPNTLLLSNFDHIRVFCYRYIVGSAISCANRRKGKRRTKTSNLHMVLITRGRKTKEKVAAVYKVLACVSTIEHLFSQSV